MWGDHTKGKNKVRQDLPRIMRPKETPPEFDYSSFYGETGAGRPLLCDGGLAFLTDVPSHSVPRGDRAPYRTSISVSCADPLKTLLMENDAPGGVRPGANSKEH